jgi:type IV pilus assembly protein PilE
MKGFNLIELVIAIAIIGILAAVAYPSYTDSVRKSRRAEAKAALVELAQWMERIYSESFDYTEDATGTALDPDHDIPIKKTPKQGTAEYYKITLSNWTSSSFTLNATPQAPQDVDGCKTLILTHTGKKDLSSDHTLSIDECW